MKSTPTRAIPVASAAAITILFWGSAFAGIRAGLHSYSPAHLALLRFFSASVILAIFAAANRGHGTPWRLRARGTLSPSHMRRPALRDIPLIFLLGFLGFAFYAVALNIGELRIPAGPAAVLIQTIPIWTALAAVIFLREKLRPWGWVGIAVSFAGAVVIGFGKGSGVALSWGAALILAAAISGSAYNIIQKLMLDRYRPVEITTYAIWAGTVLLLPFSGGLIGQIRSAALGDTIAVIYLGAGPAALAYATWAVVLSRLPASRASTFLFVVPVVAFLIGWIWLGEVPPWIDLVGGALAMGGVALVNTLGRARRQGRRQVSPGPAARSSVR
jgi:drug/metabolite transporter (DMT)-like permease